MTGLETNSELRAVHFVYVSNPI